MHAATIVTHSYLAHARTVAQSFLSHNPGARFTAVVLGDGEVRDREPFEVLSELDLGLSDLARRRRAYNDFEYALSFKPSLLRWLLKRDELAVYLDADVFVPAPFTGLDEVLAGADVGLVPHLLSPLPDDGLQPSAPGILRSGVFNAGVVAVRRTSGADSFLNWWAERLITGCRSDPANGYFVDQRWLDLAPGLFPGVRMIRDKTWNLGYWNLSGEDLVRDAAGWQLGGRTLRAFHFSGFNPTSPQRLSAHQNRIVVHRGSPLAALCEEYAAAMIANGYRHVADGGLGTLAGRAAAKQRLRLRLSRHRAKFAGQLGRGR